MVMFCPSSYSFVLESIFYSMQLWYFCPASSFRKYDVYVAEHALVYRLGSTADIIAG